MVGAGEGGDIVTALARPDTNIYIYIYIDGTTTEMDGDDHATVAVTIDRVVQHSIGEITPFTGYARAVNTERTDDGWKVPNYRLAPSTVERSTSEPGRTRDRSPARARPIAESRSLHSDSQTADSAVGAASPRSIDRSRS